MRATLISMIAVILLSVGVCIFSVLTIGHVVSEMESMRTEVLDMIDEGRFADAEERLGQMAEMWSRHEGTLAVLASHEDLHEITELLIEGDANLKADDLDDFERSMALLGEAIHHLHEEERLSISNIL